MKKYLVYGIEMTSIQNMMFSKYVNDNNISMNTKTEKERMEITADWLKNNEVKTK